MSHAIRFFAMFLPMACFMGLLQTNALAQTTTPTPLDDSCGHAYAWPEGYSQATFQVARFRLPEHNRTVPDVRFLFFSSTNANSWSAITFLADNTPANYWAPARAQEFSATPAFDTYPTIFKNTPDNKNAMLAVVPIYVEGGVEYCLQKQLLYTQLVQTKTETKTVHTEQMGTTTISPAFATLQVQFLKP